MSGEFDFIESLRNLARHPAARGLADDAAVLEFGDQTLILTHDAMVEGRHWLPGQDMADIAWKLVAVNLSDLAAKGAEPLGVLLGHTLGDGDARFVEGLHEVLEAYDVPLLGGDTVAGSGARTLGCTAIGKATHTPVPGRDRARIGDAIYVTGLLGAAMLGFEALRDGAGGNHSPYSRPRPLLAEGRALAPHVTAMMDVSDGLLLDCWRMAEASATGTFALDRAQIPVADAERRDACMRWGDDYQLLFTANPERDLPVETQRIGTVVEGDIGLMLDSIILDPEDGLGYRHG